MAEAIHITPEVRALLVPFFPRGLGDAPEPALPSPPRPIRPGPAAAAHRELMEA